MTSKQHLTRCCETTWPKWLRFVTLRSKFRGRAGLRGVRYSSYSGAGEGTPLLSAH